MKMDNDYKKLIKFLKKRSDWTDNGKTLRHNRNDGENAAIFYFDNSVRGYNPYYRISSTTFHIYKSRELILKDSNSVVVK